MNLKNEKGAVTLFVLVSCLFFLTSVACVNMYLQTKQSAVNKEYQQIKANYEKDLANANTIYNNLKNRDSMVSFGTSSQNDETNTITLPFAVNTTDYKSVKYFWLSHSSSLSVSDLNNYLRNPTDEINWTYVEKENNLNIQATVSTLNSGNRYYYLCVILDNNTYWSNSIENTQVLPDGLTIGTRVAYTTDSTSNWSAELYSSSNDVNTDNITLQASSSGSIVAGNVDMSITNWKVFSINAQNHTVELISDSPTTGKVTLCEPQGYNNGVYLLNNACNELYSKTVFKNSKNYAITGRNVNREDIEERMTELALDTGENAVHKYTDTITYGNQYSNAFTSGHNRYPLIYANEYYSVINGRTNTNSSSLKTYEQINPVHRTDTIQEIQEDGTYKNNTPSNDDGRVKAEVSIQPYQTYYKTENEFMQVAFKSPRELSSETDGTQNTNYKMLMLDSNENVTTYWLASRCIDLDDSNCNYRICAVHNGTVRAYRMYNSGGGSGSQNFALRPIITVSNSLISGDISSGFRVE